MKSQVKTAADSRKEIKRVKRRCKQQVGRVAWGLVGVASHEPYNTGPPTFGPHYVPPASAGFYDQALPDETLVRSLEHGYVVI
jgi:hypothetical protein